jgi:hypothetical protein
MSNEDDADPDPVNPHWSWGAVGAICETGLSKPLGTHSPASILARGYRFGQGREEMIWKPVTEAPVQLWASFFFVLIGTDSGNQRRSVSRPLESVMYM